MRCYNFAHALKQYGLTTEVFSFADNLGARYGEEESEMSLLEKVNLNIKAFKILLKKEKDSIFFMQRLNYHTLAPFFVSSLRRHRFIFDCDDWNIREEPKYYLGFFPSSKMDYLTRKIAKYATICITASRFLKDYLKRFNDRVYYIPTGVDTEVFKPNGYRDDSKVTFSWIGTLYHKEMLQNVRFIIDCFSVLADKYNNIYLNLAGEGRFFRGINDYMDNLRCKDKIILNNWISPDDIPGYLSNIDVGLLPLIQDTRFNRAKSPTKLFEYMAMAKPTVSSNIGEAGHIIKDGENGFLARTREEFVEKMGQLIEDRDLCRSIGYNARDTVDRHYSLNVLAGSLCEILKKI